MGAQEIFDAVGWAKIQKELVKVVLAFGDVRLFANSNVDREIADDVDQIPTLDRKLRTFHAYVTYFTSGDENRVVRNSGDSQGREAWRRRHNEYDPTSSTRRVTVHGYVQNPTFPGDAISRCRRGADGKTHGNERRVANGLVGGGRSQQTETRWEPRVIEVRYAGHHARTGAVIDLTSAGVKVGSCPQRFPDNTRWSTCRWVA